MKVGIAAHASAAVEQPRVVGSDALEARIDRALDLGVGRASVPEQRPVVHERSDEIEDQVGIDVLAQVIVGCARSSIFLTAARGGSNSVVMNAARRSRSQEQSGEQRADHVGWHAPEGGDERL
jgi:hypothetical protein